MMGDITHPDINTIAVSIFSAGLTFSGAWLIMKRKAAAQEKAALLARLTDLEAKYALVSQAVIPITTAFQAILIKELTHDHKPKMDRFLQKLGPPNTLTVVEKLEFLSLLKERMIDMGADISDAERGAAYLL